ncbi:MAG TPA: hypothetical protein PK586_07880 [Casimicrobium sp.]|nr:hypothetical protein [Casimicrobium sp.]
MSLKRSLAIVASCLLSAVAFGQSAEIFDPAELPSKTVFGPVPMQNLSVNAAHILSDTRSGLINSAGTGAGGADESVLQNTTLAMTGLGGSVFSGASGFRLAQQFTVPAGGWLIDKFTVYAYQTGSTTTSTFTAMNFRVWNGAPNVVGSTVVFGDTTTNRMTATMFSGIYRVTQTSGGTTQRPIMAIEAAGANLTLPAGTYWMDFQLSGSLASGPFAPPLTTNGTRITGDALQFSVASSTWGAYVDGGVNGGAQGFPLTVTGPNVGITVTQSGGTTNVTEGGATDDLSVVLIAPPTADVVVTLVPNAQVSVSPATLTFTSANWNIAQSVTVTAVDDAVAEAAHTGSVGFTVTSTDALYNAFAVPSVAANITDNDNAGVTTVQSAGSAVAVIEGGNTGTVTLALTSQPTANVVFTLTAGPYFTVSPATVTFTPANWNVPQVVTVTAINNNVPEGLRISSLAITVASADPLYNARAMAAIPVYVTDNDAVSIPTMDARSLALLLLFVAFVGSLTLRRLR